MLDHDDVLLRSQHGPDHSGGIQTLFDIKVRAWLVKHIDVYVLHAGQTYDEPLQLSSGKLTNFTTLDALELQLFADLIEYTLFVEMLQTFADDSLGD